jgi:hypothetical protein
MITLLAHQRLARFAVFLACSTTCTGLGPRLLLFSSPVSSVCSSYRKSRRKRRSLILHSCKRPIPPPLSSHCLNVVRAEHEGRHAEAYGGLDVASWPVGQPLLDSLRRQLAGASANMHTTHSRCNLHFAARMNLAAVVARLQTSCEMLTAWPTLWLTGGHSLVWQEGPRRSSPCKRPGDQPARRLRARDNHEKIWQTISK